MCRRFIYQDRIPGHATRVPQYKHNGRKGRFELAADDIHFAARAAHPPQSCSGTSRLRGRTHGLPIT